MNRRNTLKSIFLGCAAFPVAHRLSPAATPVEQSDKPALRTFLMPSYPPLLRQAGSEGTVSVTARITEHGTVESLKHFSGSNLFYDEVERCVRTWRFEPREGGATELKMMFHFALRGVRDQKCLHFQVSGELPNSFLIEANPFPDVNS